MLVSAGTELYVTWKVVSIDLGKIVRKRTGKMNENVRAQG